MDDATRSTPAAGLSAAELHRMVTDEGWPIDRRAKFAKVGVTPVGTVALHCPAYAVASLNTTVLTQFGEHLINAMKQARGIGLAANQVNVPVRVIAHDYPDLLPQVLVNPQVLASSGAWSYSEGCLSLDLEGTRAVVVRPRRVCVRASTLSGARLVVEADELLARVLQHELDHIDGIEYVQRVAGDEQVRVYALMSDAGIDVGLMPPVALVPAVGGNASHEPDANPDRGL